MRLWRSLPRSKMLPAWRLWLTSTHSTSTTTSGRGSCRTWYVLRIDFVLRVWWTMTTELSMPTRFLPLSCVLGWVDFRSTRDLTPPRLWLSRMSESSSRVCVTPDWNRHWRKKAKKWNWCYSNCSPCQPERARCLPPDHWGVPPGADLHGWRTGTNATVGPSTISIDLLTWI